MEPVHIDLAAPELHDDSFGQGGTPQSDYSSYEDVNLGGACSSGANVGKAKRRLDFDSDKR